MVYLKYNSVKLPVLDNYNIAKSSQEITFSDLKCDFTGHQKADLPEKYQEVRVVEESKVNREIEKIEYEEKKDVKELSFESKVKEKISICKVHGYSSQETREESKSTVTGTEVIVNDTYINNQTKFNIDGNSYQETTEGKNLVNSLKDYPAGYSTTVNGVTFTLLENGKVKVNGTATGRAAFTFVRTIKLEAGDYSLSYGSPNVTVEFKIGTNYPKVAGYSKTISLTSKINVDYVACIVNVGATVDNEIVYAQIEKGTVATGYEPYTGGIPSPSPDYPQEITSVGGYDNIFDKNNIINGSYVSDGNGAFVSNSTSKRTDYIEIQASSYYYIYSDKTSGNWGAWYDKDKNFISGITLGGKEEGVVNSPANAKYIAFTVSYQGNLIDYSKIKINETAIKIKQSGKNWFDNTKASPLVLLRYSNGIYSANDNDTNTVFGYKIQQYDSNRKFISLAGEVRQNINKPGIYYFTAQKYTTAKYLRIGNIGKTKEFQLYYPLDSINVGDYYTVVINIIDTTIGASKFKDVMLLKGKITSASYEPYHEPIITPISLQGNILSKVGEVKDILRINRNGEVEIKKNTWEETINTSNFISLSSHNTKGLVLTTSKKKTTSYSDNEYLVTNAQRNRTFNDGTVYQNPSNFVFVGSPTDTLETIKAKFNGGKILYQLATPQIITLPSISPIELWQGTNIFSLVTNLDTEIELEYNYIPQSPSPEFPSEIKNVKENVIINIRNKNFCDLDILEKLKEKAITINSSNSFTINLENGRMGITSRINIMLPDGIDKSKKYRIKYHRKMNNTSFLPRLSALYVDGSKEEVEDRILEADYEYVTSGKELSGMTLSWFTQNQGGIVTFSNISITEINENSDFEESKKQTIIFPFNQGQKLMQGDYLADDGIHHTRKQIVFNGKEEWKLGGRQFDKCMTFYVYARDGNTRGAKICNLFKFDDMAYIDKKDTECITNNVLGRNFFNNYSNKKVKIENRKCCGISRIFVEAIQ